jgi:hypothetical protein
VGEIVRDEEMIEELREALRRWNDRPQELWDELVRRGVIDKEGNVLVRMPEPPDQPPTDRKKRQRKDQ